MSANTVGERLSQEEELIVKLQKAEKDREKGTDSYGFQIFAFHTEGFSTNGLQYTAICEYQIICASQQLF